MINIYYLEILQYDVTLLLLVIRHIVFILIPKTLKFTSTNLYFVMYDICLLLG